MAEEIVKAVSSIDVDESAPDLSSLSLQDGSKKVPEETASQAGSEVFLDPVIREEASPSRSHLDEVLVEALRSPRDRIFILRQEKDMEERIRSGTEQEWELLLMNSYQRLLVHRIADHFHLAHSIDSTTKAVTLTRQDDTCIPELSITAMALTDVERLSEPSFTLNTSKDGSGAFKIMRREGAGRSGSPRSGLGDAGNGKDRRNMTIEEREAAYREARQRIFGSEDGGVDTSADASVSSIGEGDAKCNGGEASSSSRGASRKGTPGHVSPAPSSTSSTSSAAFLRAGAPSFDPRGASVEPQWQQSYPNPMMDPNNQQQYYPYPSGYVWPMMQYDANGRQIINAPLASPYYQAVTPGSSGSNQDVYSSLGPSPSTSSRSTSVSAEGEGGPAVGSRSNSVETTYASMAGNRGGSPHVPLQRNVGSNGSMGSNNVGMTPHAYQGQIAVPASWNYYQPNMPNYNGMSNNNNMRPYPVQQNPFPRNGPTNPSSGSSSYTSGSGPGYLSTAASSSNFRIDEGVGGDNSYYNAASGGTRSGRVRSSQQPLFDPNKAEGSNRLEGSSGPGRQMLGKSASAAGKLESRPPPSTAGLPLSTQDMNQRASSSSTSSSSSPSHPSLPARPDWVLSKSRPPIESPKTDTQQAVP
jgi:hypothetical protein